MSKPKSPIPNASCNMEGTSIPLGNSVSQSVGYSHHLQQNYGGNSLSLEGNKWNLYPWFLLFKGAELNSWETVSYYLKTFKECRLQGYTPDHMNDSLWAWGVGCGNLILKAQSSWKSIIPEDIGFLSLMKESNLTTFSVSHPNAHQTPLPSTP